jgi:hypothetical protein
MERRQAMYPNNDEIMYRYSQMHNREIRGEVDAVRDAPTHVLDLRRRITVISGLILVGLTVALTLLALGWWVL